MRAGDRRYQYHCIDCGAWWEDDAPGDGGKTTCTCEDGGRWEADRV